MNSAESWSGSKKKVTLLISSLAGSARPSGLDNHVLGRNVPHRYVLKKPLGNLRSFQAAFAFQEVIGHAPTAPSGHLGADMPTFLRPLVPIGKKTAESGDAAEPGGGRWQVLSEGGLQPHWS